MCVLEEIQIVFAMCQLHGGGHVKLNTPKVRAKRTLLPRQWTQRTTLLFACRGRPKSMSAMGDMVSRLMTA